LLYLQRKGGATFTPEEQTLLQNTYYHRDLIKMVGVWDTVGSIGIPFGNLPGISSRTLRFHNTHLSTIVQHSYQALALDEQRQPYWAILWTTYTLKTPPAEDSTGSNDRFVEQRWFAGAHANIGGSYENDTLPIRPRGWLQEKASACGLAFKRPTVVTDEDLKQQPRDSYTEFLGGVWKWFGFIKLFQRYVRWVMSDPKEKPEHTKNGQVIPAGTVRTVNERIDPSVFRRCQLYPDYRPTSLKEWAARKLLDLNAVIAAPDKHPQLTAPITQPGIETGTIPASNPAQSDNPLR